jgi:prepilin-type N-terminal cleavage/methylation domain-containing protein
MRKWPPSKSQGFTLIELSIVLVIIGLIISTVVVGSSLVQQSAIRAVINDVSNINSGINAFKIQYNALPGDIANATTYFGATDTNGYTVTNGNGDGYIGPTDINLQENLSAAQELALAGYINGTYTGALSGGLTIPAINTIPSKYAKNTNYWFYGSTLWNYFSATNAIVLTGPNSVGWNDPRVSVGDAKIIDDKIDDGMPYTGHVISYHTSANNCVATPLSSAPAKTLPYLVTSNTLCVVHMTLVKY